MSAGIVLLDGNGIQLFLSLDLRKIVSEKGSYHFLGSIGHTVRPMVDHHSSPLLLMASHCPRQFARVSKISLYASMPIDVSMESPLMTQQYW